MFRKLFKKLFVLPINVPDYLFINVTDYLFINVPINLPEVVLSLLEILWNYEKR